MLCKNCGRPVVDGQCPACGVPGAADAAAPPEQLSETPVKERKKMPVPRRVLIWAIAAVLIFGGGLAVLINQQLELDMEPVGDIVIDKPAAPENDVQNYLHEIDPAPLDETALEPWKGILTPGHWTAGYDFPAGYYQITALEGFGQGSTNNSSSGNLDQILSALDAAPTVITELFLGRGTVLTLNGPTVMMESRRADLAGFTPRETTLTERIRLSEGSYRPGVDFPAGVYDLICVSGSGHLYTERAVFSFGIDTTLNIAKEKATDYSSFHGVILSTDTVFHVAAGMVVELIPTQGGYENLTTE